MSKIKMGDFIRISYNLRVQETGQLIETTDEELAKKENIYDEKQIYNPRLMIVGNEEQFIKPLNEAMVGKEVGQKFKLEIPPEDTFGYYDPSKVKLLGRKELVAKNIIPEVGKQIQWGNQNGVVKSVLGGRVRVDFNHPLVGQVIVYEVEVLEKITAVKKKVQALIDNRMPGVDIKKFKLTVEDKKITIEIPEEILNKDPYIQFRKIRIASDIENNLPKITQVTFIDTFTFTKNSD